MCTFVCVWERGKKEGCCLLLKSLKINERKTNAFLVEQPNDTKNQSLFFTNLNYTITWQKMVNSVISESHSSAVVVVYAYVWAPKLNCAVLFFRNICWCCFACFFPPFYVAQPTFVYWWTAGLNSHCFGTPGGKWNGSQEAKGEGDTVSNVYMTRNYRGRKKIALHREKVACM